jgi:hypothetical protein
MKRELKTRPTYDCRCDERLKPKDDESTYTVFFVVYYESIKRGTGTPKDKDEVNKREVCECEG